MKKYLYLLLACMLVSTGATAQDRPRRGGGDWGPPGAEERVERLSENLGLDEKQAAKLLEIFTDADAQRDALQEQHREQMRQYMCVLHEDTTSQIKSVLTAQQSDEFDELMARMKTRREDHRGRHDKGRRPALDCEEAGS